MKRAVLLGIKALISGALLSFVLSRIPLHEILQAAVSANVWYLFAVVPFVLAVPLLSALQFKILADCHNMTLSFTQILSVNLATYFYNLFLPGYVSGGVIRWYRFSKDNRKKAEVFAAIILNRWVNLTAVAAIGLVAWVLEENPRGHPLIGLFLSVVFLVLGVSLLLLNTHGLLRLLEKFAERTGDVHPKLREKSLKLIYAAREYQQLPWRQHAALYSYALLWQILPTVTAYIICLALQVNPGILSLFWIRTFVAYALLFPVSISGLGIREGALVYFLGLYGIAAPTAFLISILIFGSSLLLGIVGALLELRSFFQSRAVAREVHA